MEYNFNKQPINNTFCVDFEYYNPDTIRKAGFDPIELLNLGKLKYKLNYGEDKGTQYITADTDLTFGEYIKQSKQLIILTLEEVLSNENMSIKLLDIDWNALDKYLQPNLQN